MTSITIYHARRTGPLLTLSPEGKNTVGSRLSHFLYSNLHPLSLRRNQGPSHLSSLRWLFPPPVRPPTITKFLKPYVLKMHFTNKYVSAQVVHSPTATVASSASSQEKALRESLESHRDVAAAAKIGKILGERLLLKNIPAVSVHLKREQKYHGKVKAVIDNVVEAGVKLL